MSTVVSSFKIWALAVFLNGFLFGLVQMLSGSVWGVAISATVLLMGYVIGLPFWLLILVLIEVATRFPYSATGRACWVAGIAGAFIALFYACLSWIINGRFTLNYPNISWLTGTTIAALFLSLYLNRKAFNKVTIHTPVSNNQQLNEL